MDPWSYQNSYYAHYFTGPIEHDLLAELIFAAVALSIIFVIWKLGKFNWPDFRG